MVPLCKIKGTLLGGNKTREWKEFFDRGDLTFWVVAPCHKPPLCQVWSV